METEEKQEIKTTIGGAFALKHEEINRGPIDSGLRQKPTQKVVYDKIE